MTAYALPPTITREHVIRHSQRLPSFPAIVSEIMNTLDDPDSNFNVLVRAIRRDPLISARVLAVANTVALRSARQQDVCDLATATALIGLNRVRHITLISSLNTFLSGIARDELGSMFWRHSVAVGICCEELVLHLNLPVAPAKALVAGLLHDMGQLWLHSIDPVYATACIEQARRRGVDVETLELEHFGIGHSRIGAWLAGYWTLPSDVVAAIEGHHQPDPAAQSALVPLLHVAEVMCNALDLPISPANHVTKLSSLACKQIGINWNDGVRVLFGRIEARSQQANDFFKTVPS